ncbi:MAG TPA: DUF4279 domain-containing protein [Longimicrobiaceae bacterium]|nr:DUF4279 domain-containing protein [Longimicrobiaceae bacterium]
MPPPRIRCWFEIRSARADPADITRELGLAPTRVWRAGESLTRGGVAQEMSGWRFEHPIPPSIDLDEMACALLDLLPSELPEAAITGNWVTQLTYVIEVQDRTPAMFFEDTTLSRLARLRASIDIDLYVAQIE